jgi:purine-cytosine permease-like protein
VIVTPSTFMLIEEILVVIAIVAAAAWYFSRRWRDGAKTGRATPKYHPLLVLLHWAVAFVIANLLLRGVLIMRYIPNTDPEKIDGLRAHMYAGTLVFVLMLIRLVVRRKTQLPHGQPRVTVNSIGSPRPRIACSMSSCWGRRSAASIWRCRPACPTC